MTILPKPSPRALHLVLDMQRLFADHPDWGVADLPGLIAPIRRLARHAPARTCWSRFIPAQSAETAIGCWHDYYRRWPQATLAAGAAIDILPDFADLLSPDRLFDKSGYSLFTNPAFAAHLRAHSADMLILSGVETDVCVWATALDAIDRGYGILLVADALASYDQRAHRAILEIIAPRLSPQIGITDSAALLAEWRPQ